MIGRAAAINQKSWAARSSRRRSCVGLLARSVGPLAVSFSQRSPPLFFRRSSPLSDPGEPTPQPTLRCRRSSGERSRASAPAHAVVQRHRASLSEPFHLGPVLRSALGRTTSARRAAWLVADALLGSLICFGLYFAAASWGLGARKPSGGRGELDLRRDRVRMALRLAVAIAGVVWYAIAINFARRFHAPGPAGVRTDSAASGVAPWRAGPFDIKSPVFLGTALFWIYITRTGHHDAAVRRRRGTHEGVCTHRIAFAYGDCALGNTVVVGEGTRIREHRAGPCFGPDSSPRR